MKSILLFICITFPNIISAQNTAVNSDELKTELDKFITSNDSLTIANKNYSEMKSYWIVFNSKNNKAELDLIANFDFYSSKKMIGYFEYRGKIVSVYEYGKTALNNFIKKENLKKGKIKNLVDYDDKDSIVPEHEPRLKRYNVRKNKLEKIK